MRKLTSKDFPHINGLRLYPWARKSLNAIIKKYCLGKQLGQQTMDVYLSLMDVLESKGRTSDVDVLIDTIQNALSKEDKYIYFKRDAQYEDRGGDDESDTRWCYNDFENIRNCCGFGDCAWFADLTMQDSLHEVEQRIGLCNGALAG